MSESNFSVTSRSTAHSGPTSVYSDDVTTEYDGASTIASTVDPGVAPPRPDAEPRDPDTDIPKLSLGGLRPIRTALPKEEGTAEAEAAAKEAHRIATQAAKRLAAREWIEARTPRAPPTRTLNMLDVLHDSGANQFQEWVPSGPALPEYVKLLYAAANPVTAHPLYDLDPETPPDSPRGEGGEGGRYGRNTPRGRPPLPNAVTPRTRAARFKSLFKRKTKDSTPRELPDDESKGFNFLKKSKSKKRLAQEQLEAAAGPVTPRVPLSARGPIDMGPTPPNTVLKDILEEMQEDAEMQVKELRQRFIADGNGAAADVLRVEAAGFEEACDFKEETVDLVAERIFEVLSACGMAHALPLSFNAVFNRVFAELEECIEEAVWGSQVFYRRWGLDVRDLIARTPEWTMRNCSRWNETEAFVQIGRTLNLSKEQRAQLLSARQYLHEKYNKVYAERQELNERIFDLLQPPPPVSPEYEEVLREALQKLAGNLAEEQRIHSEEEFICFKQILNPVQGAWAILKSMPEHCDVTALWNAIAEVYG